VKTETITIKARDVRKGDITPWGVATSDAFNLLPRCFEAGEATITPSPEFTIARPVADPCPRGRMTIDSDGDIELDGRIHLVFSSSGRDNGTIARIVALWNEAEREPYRTTEEIERGIHHA
jgi:hypothetical protein